MPWGIRKVRGRDCFRVTNLDTGRVKAFCTSREKTEAQVRLLRSFGK